MTMNDLRENPIPPVEQGSTPKIVAALVVALGFGAMGAYSYETGTWNSQPKQVTAAQVPSPEPVASATPSEPPLQSAADLPPAPVKNIPAQTSPQAAAPPPVKIARAQIPAPAFAREVAVQPSTTIPTQPSPEVAAPVVNVPEQPVSQVSTISPAVNAPATEAPAQTAPEPPAEAPPAQ